MADSIVGLVFEISSDPSQANAAIAAFSAQSGQSIGLVQAQMQAYKQAESDAYAEAAQRMRGMADQAAEVDKALLSNKESARLLAEEFGIHLPRAVTGAIAEILPAVGSIGGALLAAFAFKEILAGWGYVIEKLYDVKGSEEELKLAANENKTAMEEEAKKSLDYARAQVTLLLTQITAMEASKDAFHDHSSSLTALAGPLGLVINSYKQITGQLEDMGNASKEIHRLEELRDQMVKILGNDEEELAKKREKYFADQEKREGEAQAADKRASQAADTRLKAEERGLDELSARYLEYRNQQITEEDRYQKELTALIERNTKEQNDFTFRAMLDVDKVTRQEDDEALKEAESSAKRRFEIQKQTIKQAQDQEAENLRLSLSYQALSIVGMNTYNRMLQEAKQWASGTVTAHQMTQGAIVAETEAMLIQGMANHSIYAQMLQSLISFLAKKAGLKSAEDFAMALDQWGVYASSGYTDAPALDASIHFGLAGLAWGALGGGMMAAGSMIGGAGGGGSNKTTKAASAPAAGSGATYSGGGPGAPGGPTVFGTVIFQNVQYTPAAIIGSANAHSHAVEIMGARLIGSDTTQRRQSGNG